MARFANVLIFLSITVFGLVSCQTPEMEGIQAARVAMQHAIPNEEPGEYFIGRRFYKRDYKFWGYVRSPRQPWSAAKLVMLNEQTRLAPDRDAGQLGSDNNYEYKLYGSFSGQPVYEPASNGFYPEFVLKSYELKSVSPPNIFRTPGATDPARRIIAQPF